jgi:hypothetical protein
MFFLMNDVVFNIDLAARTTGLAAHWMHSLSFNAVSELGQELYAQDPLLHITHPERASRLASLIVAKAPAINAAQFLATSSGCRPGDVIPRYCRIEFEVMAQLLLRQSDGPPDTLRIDREVWRRLAA